MATVKLYAGDKGAAVHGVTLNGARYSVYVDNTGAMLDCENTTRIGQSRAVPYNALKVRSVIGRSAKAAFIAAKG